jgi:arachidonate 15-lipoxygenase
MARAPSLPPSSMDARRAAALERARGRYEYRSSEENLLHPIATAAKYPCLAEGYTPAYVWRIGTRWVWAYARRFFMLDRFAVDWATFRFDKMRAYDDLLSSPLPPFAKHADSDEAFAWWRVAGANPLGLRQERSLERLHRRIPFDVQRCEARLASKGRHVDLAREAHGGRLFAVDFRLIQQSLRPARDARSPDLLRDSRWRAKYLPAPIGVFLELPGTPVGLAPLAIQIDQPREMPHPGRPEEPNPIYYPDGGWGWRIAKLYFEVADVSFQLSCGHIHRTHLVIEPFALATPRQLAPEHPIRILLRPHLRFMLPVNRAAYDYFRKRRKLYFDVHAGTLEEMREIARQSYHESDFRRLELEAELTGRGVGRLPEVYPYRDDARLWLRPIRKFVEAYVLAFYESDHDVENDYELQAWASELVDPARGAVRNLVEDGRLDDRGKLIDLLTQALFTAGPGHASQHYSSTYYYRYAPVFPGAAYRPPPWKPERLNEARFQNTLPPIRTAARQWSYNTFTSFRMSPFGHYGRSRLARLREARKAIVELQEELRWVEAEIAQRNEQRPYPYEFLLPSRVPNSIHI